MTMPGYKNTARDARLLPENYAPSLVDLLNVEAGTGTGASSGSTSAAHILHASGHAIVSALVQLGHDGGADTLEHLELVLELLDHSELVGVEPLDGGVNGPVDGFLVALLNLGSDPLLSDGVAHAVSVVLEGVNGFDLLLVLLVLSLVFLGVLDHLLDLVLGQAALIVGDGDLPGISGGLVLGRHVEDAVGVDIEGDVNLGDGAGGGGMPVSSNLPRRLLSQIRARSPSYTWMSTPGWLSE